MHSVAAPSTAEAFTRVFPDVVDVSGESLFLEVGTGSGRITRGLTELLLSSGGRLIGVDLSHRKLCRLAAQTAAHPTCLVQADARRLPFPSATFDAVITARVLHLVDDPELALREFGRLLKPSGVYVRLVEVIDEDSVWHRIRSRWQGLLQKSSLAQFHQGRSDGGVDDILLGMGAGSTCVPFARTRRCTTPAREIEHLAVRVGDGTWAVPTDLLPGLLEDIQAWAKGEFKSLEREFVYDESSILQVWRF